ncbi:hypothetical protein [Bdellovibrio sp. HCB337]|uniref:hypothetical protein n=1 Tax=Bdellovibrio sp. HCB337 TaxID=3394358 RepID=UPI0039A4CE84
MTSFTKYGGLTALALLVALGFQNCAQVQDQEQWSEFKMSSTSTGYGNINEGVESILLKSKISEQNPHRCVKTRENCFSETFKQPIKNTRAVDVLFVVQTSASISAQRQAIVAGINDFITSLPMGSNFNIGVMLAHGSRSNWAGRLYRAQAEPIVLKSAELTNAQIQEYIGMKLNQVVMDPDAGGGEEGLFSLYRGITTPVLLSDSQGAGFFRADAALGVVFVADRRDICAVVPAGVAPETDPNKLAARNRDCEGLTANGLSNQLKVLKGTLPLAVSGIIYADAPAPAGKEIGYGYTDMIALNPGVAIDIANDDIDQGLASIAELSGQQMMVQNEFILDYTGIDPKTVIVTVNGVGVAYTLDGNKVTIKSTIPAGAVVVIAYCLKSKPNTNGCHHRMKKGHKDGSKKYKNRH